jgi:hypothetical protein
MRVFLSFAVIFFLSLDSYAQHNVWGRIIGDTLSDVAQAVAVDSKGNVYSTGQFAGTVDFDPGVGVMNLSSSGGPDIFITMFNSFGDLVWAKALGGTSLDLGTSIAVDISGNVYTTGWFRNTVDFDPGAASFNLQSMGIADIFISKLDSNGNFVWAKRFGAASNDVGTSVKVDGTGNVFCTGGFQTTVDFDPGPGVMNLSSAGGEDIFIVKLSSAGNLMWAKAIGGTGADRTTDIAVDNTGSIYTSGTIDSTADFDPGPMTFLHTPVGFRDGFILKLDPSGNFTWVRTMGGSNEVYPSCIALDANGNIYTAGSYKDTADFNPGSAVFNLISSWGDDLFVVQLTSAGNFLWAKTVAGSWGAIEACDDIAVDNLGNIYMTGLFEQTADFNPGSGTFNLISAGQIDIFVSKLDNAGNFVWATSSGDINVDRGYELAVDVWKNVYVSGFILGTVDVNPSTGVYNLTSSGSADIFIQRIAQCTTSFTISKAGNLLTAPAGYNSYQWYRNDTAIVWATTASYTTTQSGNYYVIAADTARCVGQSNTLAVITSVDDINDRSSFSIYPNPTSGKITIGLSGPLDVEEITVTVFNYTGAKVLMSSFHSRSKSSHELDLNMNKGIYLVQLEAGHERIIRKVVVQ